MPHRGCSSATPVLFKAQHRSETIQIGCAKSILCRGQNDMEYQVMRKFTSFLLLAAALLPATAQASTSRGELARDARDIREERRDLNRAYRSGDPREIRDEREDLREAKQEYREDLNDRRVYPYRPGVRLAPIYYGPRYVIAEPWRYRLARPAGDDRWVRRSNDAILVNTRSGTIRFVHRGYFR